MSGTKIRLTATSKSIRSNLKRLLTVFDDPYALIAPDEKHSTAKEKREWIIGESDQGILVIVFTRRIKGAIYRIISARKANRKERRTYEEYKKLPL